MHLLHHIVDGIQRFGPVYSTWMFPYERFNSWMCRRALNRANPEATIMQTYRVRVQLQLFQVLKPFFRSVIITYNTSITPHLQCRGNTLTKWTANCRVLLNTQFLTVLNT